jgi:hypothetical protein
MTDQPVILMHDRPPALPRGRLIFALDATASREPTWDIARELQAKMFREAAPLGQLDMQLVFFRNPTDLPFVFSIIKQPFSKRKTSEQIVDTP